MTVAVVLAAVIVIGVVAGLVVLAVRLWRGRVAEDDDHGLDLIPYILLALAVGIAGFSLAELANASLAPDRLSGRPTSEIAFALAGLVGAAPIAYFLWRRQATRRAGRPSGPGWPVYLALVELVFLVAFFTAVAQIADSLTSTALTARWPNLIVYGGIVAFHWWAERREPPMDDAGDLPRLVGSGVALVALAGGAIATLGWLLSEAYESLIGAITFADPAEPLALMVIAAPVWAFRWLPAWRAEPNAFRNLYLAVVTVFSLTLAIGAAATLVAVFLSFMVRRSGTAAAHFDVYPVGLAVGVVGWATWAHHRRRLGQPRNGAIRGYEYSMAAIGLGTLVGASVGLIDAAFEPRFADTGTGVLLITLGCTVIASGAVWLWFWRKVQAAPRATEVPSLQRRVYLIGMAFVTGLTAAGALIGSLVVVFRAVLGEGGDVTESLRFPLTLTVVSGLAAWHLFTHIRRDSAGRRQVEVKPFTVTVVCSHPGDLTKRFPVGATTRILYRADDTGIIDEETADAIVAAVGTSSALVWVDGDGFRVAAARET